MNNAQAPLELKLRKADIFNACVIFPCRFLKSSNSSRSMSVPKMHKRSSLNHMRLSTSPAGKYSFGDNSSAMFKSSSYSPINNKTSPLQFTSRRFSISRTHSVDFSEDDSQIVLKSFSYSSSEDVLMTELDE